MIFKVEYPHQSVAFQLLVKWETPRRLQYSYNARSFHERKGETYAIRLKYIMEASISTKFSDDSL